MRQKVSVISIYSKETAIYYLLDSNDAFNEMSKIVKETSEILGLSSLTIVRILLNYFRWDQNILTGKLVNNT